jgi:hypothetical protein
MIVFKQEKTTIGKGRTFGQGRKKMDSERLPIFLERIL